jgi:hypothetical protein
VQALASTPLSRPASSTGLDDELEPDDEVDAERDDELELDVLLELQQQW